MLLFYTSLGVLPSTWELEGKKGFREALRQALRESQLHEVENFARLAHEIRIPFALPAR